MKQPLTDERIARLIARREKLTNRRDERINFPAVNEIDAILRDVPPGERPDVDALLGRKPLSDGERMRRIAADAMQNQPPISY